MHYYGVYVLTSLLCLFEAVSASESTSAVFNLPLSRAIQFEYASTQYGSQKSYFKAPGRLFIPPSQEELLELTSITTQHEVLVVPLNDIQPVHVDIMLASSTAGVIFVFPQSALNANAESVLLTLEERLMSKAFDIPIYVVEESSLTQALIAKIAARHGDVYTFVGGEKTAIAYSKTSVTTTPTYVIDFADIPKAGKSHGGRGAVTSDDRPVLVVVASHDTMGVVPAMAPRSLNDGGSGATAILELIRMYNKLLVNPTSRPAMRVIFLLSSGAKGNYYGTKQWLHDLDAHTVDNIEFALCLDSLVESDLYLHMSRKISKDDATSGLYHTLAASAVRQGVSLKLQHRKINVSHSEMRWEHEVFAYKKIVAATLSGVSSPRPQFLRTSRTFNTNLTTILPTLMKNIQFVATALSSFLYPFTNTTAFSEGFGDASQLLSGLGPQHAHVAASASFFASKSRPFPYPRPERSAQDNTLHATLLSLTSRVAVIEAQYKGDVTFYGPITAELEVYETKSMVHEFAMTGGIMVYLCVLYVVLSQVGKRKQN
eukprot:PhF_6_TR6113/c0_g1_i1/m.9025